MIQTKATSTGLLVQITRKAQNGNRYKRAIPWGTFLQTAYGQLVRSRHIALSLQVSQSMVTMMSSMVSSVFLSQQLLLLARLATLAESTRPFLCVQHLKWDETQLECSVNPDRASRRVRSAWQVMVSRLRILLSWLDGSNIVIRLVMPPVVLLGSAAHDIFYALRFHPSYKALNQMLAVLGSRCDHRAQILESDGAYANERLVAHLIQKNKHGPEHLQHHLMHVKCFAGVGHEILNKLYGMTVFIRNLGYFLRLRQAVESWVDQNLVFLPTVIGEKVSDHVTHHPTCLEFVDFLRQSRKIESDSDETTNSFEQRVSNFLDMWNGDFTQGHPQHICSHECMPDGERHCKSRKDAVRKRVDSLVGMFLNAMPSVPAPNKWTTLFNPMDFCMTGYLVHKYLRQVFAIAFGDMVFREFGEDDAADTDPKLVESLAFHVVNGKRQRSSRLFLSNDDSQWSLVLLAICMEVTRALTWHWLSCLGKSLLHGARPPLFKVMDPRSSIVTQALQFLAALLRSDTGQGRMILLWGNMGYSTFEDFCHAEKAKVRKIRRLLTLTAGWVFRRHYMFFRSDPCSILMCADRDAHPETLQNWLEFWEVKHHCCFPPGLCRDLKRLGISKAGLMDERCKNLFFWMASCTQLSMADVEAMHSQNRNLSGSSFASVASKFTNTEANRIVEEAEKLQSTSSTKKGTSNARKQNFKSGNGGIKISVKGRCEAKSKAMSAFEHFRCRYIEMKRRFEKVNPATKEFWSQVRAAYAELTDAEKEVYQRMAAQSQEAAHSKRLQQKRVAEEGVVEPCGSSLPSSAIMPFDQSTSVHAQVIPLDELCALLPHTRPSEMKSIVQEKLQKTPLENKKILQHKYPLCEATLERAWQTQLGNCKSDHATFKERQRESESIGRPDSENDTFPKRVLHESFCGEQCRHFGEQSRIALHVSVLQLFQDVVAYLGGTKQVVQNDSLCAFEVFHTGDSSCFEFAFITAASSQSGTHRPEQVFCCLDPVAISRDVIINGGFRFEGLTLALSTLMHVQPSEHEYFKAQPVQSGRLRMYTSDLFAAHLLDLPIKEDPQLDAVHVVVHHLDFIDVSPSAVFATWLFDCCHLFSKTPSHSKTMLYECDIR